jgi:hypothetical protein
MKKGIVIIALSLLMGGAFMNSCKNPETGISEKEKAAITDTINKMMAEVNRYAGQANVDSTFKFLSSDSTAIYISGGMHFSYECLKSAFKHLYSQIKSQEYSIVFSEIKVPARDAAIWIAGLKGGYKTLDGKTVEQFLCETWIFERKPEGWKVVHYHESILNYPSQEQKELVESAVGKLAVELSAKSLKPGDMKPVLTAFLKKNPLVYGTTLAFAPIGEDGHKHVASSYYYRSGNEIMAADLPSANDYNGREWYSKPVSLKKPYWCDPYYDDGGGEVVMITYSVPVYDKENKLTGVLTGDMRLQ